MKKPIVIILAAGLSLLFFIFLTNVMYATSTVDDETAQERLEFEKEIERIKKEDPEEYREFQQISTYMAQVLLGQLGYGLQFNGVLDDNTKEAIREYQKGNGISATGDPTNFETMDKIKKDIEFLENEPRILPMLNISTDFWDDGYFSANGTWIHEGQYFTEQTSHIECRLDLGVCIDSTAYYGGGGVNLDAEIYNIERWDKSEIVTKPEDRACTRYIVRINRVQKSVTAIRSTISNEGYCEKVDKKEIHMTLKDGLEIYSKALNEYVNKKTNMFKVNPSLLKFFDEKKTNESTKDNKILNE